MNNISFTIIYTSNQSYLPEIAFLRVELLPPSILFPFLARMPSRSESTIKPEILIRFPTLVPGTITLYDNSIYEPLVSEDEQLKRLEICKACEYYAIIMGKEKCTAGRPTFLRAKISLRDQTCPSEEKNCIS